MDRRTFVVSAAASALSAAPRAPVGIAFLGVSHSHGEAKLRIVRESPDWRLVGVCEPDAKLREKLAQVGVALLGREELLRHPEVKVIAVEGPVRDHGRDGYAALAAGKHLHLEKAPADNLAEFEKIVRLAEQKNLLLQVGYMWRYNPAVIKALEAARNGWLGSVYYLRASISNLLAADRRPEWAEFPGGVMFELGGHVIDPLVRLMGRPVKITPFLRKDGAFQDTLKDNTLAVFEWAGAIGVVQGSNLQPNSSRHRVIEIQGTNGMAKVQPIEPPALEIDLDKPAGPYKAGVQKVPVPPYQRYVDDLAELAAAVRGETRLRTTFAEDLMVQEALLKASGML